MMKMYLSIVLKLCSLGIVIIAGIFWAGARVERRPKRKDEQTLVGGAIWSQTVIPIGLLITIILHEELDIFVHGYFLISGVILLISTGLFLITRECLVVTRQRRALIENNQVNDGFINYNLKFDKIYFSIGVLCLSAGIISFIDLFVTII